MELPPITKTGKSYSSIYKLLALVKHFSTEILPTTFDKIDKEYADLLKNVREKEKHLSSDITRL